MQGDSSAAKITLEQACIKAENLGSRRLLWQIIAHLTKLETDKELVMGLNEQSRAIVDFIANHISPEDLRESFLRTTAVRAGLT